VRPFTIPCQLKNYIINLKPYLIYPQRRLQVESFPLKVGIPLSALIPAPVKITTFAIVSPKIYLKNS